MKDTSIASSTSLVCVLDQFLAVEVRTLRVFARSARFAASGLLYCDATAQEALLIVIANMVLSITCRSFR